MWRTAERRFVQHDGHVCLRNPFSPWEPQHAPSSLHDGCIMLAKDRVEVSKIWSTRYWLWSRLSYIRVYIYIYATAASQWRIVLIQLLASVGWKRVCEPFADVRNMWRHVCLRNPFSPLIPSIHSPLRATARSTNSTFLHHSQIRCSWRKPVSCREAEGLVTELWSPKSVTMYILIVLLCDYCRQSF